MEVASDLSIRVAPVPVVGLLKIVAYQDQPQARTRDLEDLAHIFDEHVRADDQRRYSDEVPEAGLEFEVVSAFLLGRDMGSLVNSEERGAVTSFIAKVRDENDPHATQARMANVAPVSWRRKPEALLARFDAFDRGLVSVVSQ